MQEADSALGATVSIICDLGPDHGERRKKLLFASAPVRAACSDPRRLIRAQRREHTPAHRIERVVAQPSRDRRELLRCMTAAPPTRRRSSCRPPAAPAPRRCAVRAEVAGTLGVHPELPQFLGDVQRERRASVAASEMGRSLASDFRWVIIARHGGVHDGDHSATATAQVRQYVRCAHPAQQLGPRYAGRLSLLAERVRGVAMRTRAGDPDVVAQAVIDAARAVLDPATGRADVLALIPSGRGRRAGRRSPRARSPARRRRAAAAERDAPRARGGRRRPRPRRGHRDGGPARRASGADRRGRQPRRVRSDIPGAGAAGGTRVAASARSHARRSRTTVAWRACPAARGLVGPIDAPLVRLAELENAGTRDDREPSNMPSARPRGQRNGIRCHRDLIDIDEVVEFP